MPDPGRSFCGIGSRFSLEKYFSGVGTVGGNCRRNLSGNVRNLSELLPESVGTVGDFAQRLLVYCKFLRQKLQKGANCRESIVNFALKK